MKAIYPVAIASALIACAVLRIPSAEEENPHLSIEPRTTGVNQSSDDDYPLSFINPHVFAQEYEFGEYWDPSDPSIFAVIETDIQAGTIETFEYRASFNLLYADHFKKNLFCVLGMSTNGDFVVEKWKRTQKLSFGGNPTYIMKRFPLFQGQSLGEIRMISCDPDERFVLMLHGAQPATISQLDLTNKQITPLYSALDAPHVESIDHWASTEHAAEGRTWLLYDPGLEFVSLLQDHENDGIFDRLVTYDYDTFATLYQENPQWTDDFLTRE